MPKRSKTAPNLMNTANLLAASIATTVSGTEIANAHGGRAWHHERASDPHHRVAQQRPDRRDERREDHYPGYQLAGNPVRQTSTKMALIVIISPMPSLPLNTFRIASQTAWEAAGEGESQRSHPCGRRRRGNIE